MHKPSKCTWNSLFYVLFDEGKILTFSFIFSCRAICRFQSFAFRPGWTAAPDIVSWRRTRTWGATSFHGPPKGNGLVLPSPWRRWNDRITPGKWVLSVLTCGERNIYADWFFRYLFSYTYSSSLTCSLALLLWRSRQFQVRNITKKKPPNQRDRALFRENR